MAQHLFEPDPPKARAQAKDIVTQRIQLAFAESMARYRPRGTGIAVEEWNASIYAAAHKIVEEMQLLPLLRLKAACGGQMMGNSRQWSEIARVLDELAVGPREPMPRFEDAFVAALMLVHGYRMAPDPALIESKPHGFDALAEDIACLVETFAAEYAQRELNREEQELER